MQPTIAVIPSFEEKQYSYYVAQDHLQAINDAGGLPFIIPYEAEIDSVLKQVDGIYLTGGEDIDPTFFQEEPHRFLRNVTPARDRFEVELIKRAHDKQVPIFAVCRGAQVVNVALGGTMYQDIYSQIEHTVLQHEQRAPKSHASHDIYVQKHSLLYSLVDVEKMRVNSRHHQANCALGEGLIVSARATDGIIEAIESEKIPFLLGVQWHPENMAVTGESKSKQLYQGFIDACKKTT